MITSALKSKIFKFSSLLLLSLFAAGPIAYSQQKIQLKDVAKIDLISAGPVAGGDYEKNSIILTGNKWQIYRTFTRKGYSKGVPENTFLSDVSKANLKQLLKNVAKDVPQPDIKYFHIDKRALIKQIDSVDRRSKLRPEQRAQFIKFLKSDDSLQKALIRCVKLFNGSDYSYRYIDIINKNYDTIKLDANTRKLSFLPWMLNGKPSYNPDINVAFYRILNPKITSFPNPNYRDLIKCAFMECFHTSRSLWFFFYNMPETKVNSVREIGELGNFDPY